MATIKGTAKNDVLYGTAAADDFLAGAGDDIIFAVPGDGKIDGGSGIDTLDLSGATTWVRYVEQGGQLTYHFPGVETTYVTNIERVIGSQYDDMLFAGAGADTVVGGGGADEIKGGAGDDILVGDFLSGYAYAQPGQRGADTFHFTTGESGKDTILDFQPYIDHLFFYGVPQPTQFNTQGQDLIVTWANGTVRLVGLGGFTDYAALTVLSHGGITVG